MLEYSTPHDLLQGRLRRMNMKLKYRSPTSVGPALLMLVLLTACSSGQTDSAYIWPGETWPTSAPAEQGINGAAIDSLVADIAAGEYGLVDAFMLIRNGYVVANHRFTHDYATIAAEYDTTNHMYNYDHPDWHPYLHGTDLHSLQSVTKSVTSASLGIAMDEGLLGVVEIRRHTMFQNLFQVPML